MTQRNEPEWTDGDFNCREGQDSVEQVLDLILDLLLQGVPREWIEDELIRQGYEVEYAVALVDSAKRTGSHDGAVYGTGTFYGDNLVFFDEDPISSRRRRQAQRGQRKIRTIADEPGVPSPDLVFDDSSTKPAAGVRSRRTLAERLAVILGGTVLVVATVLYWLAIRP